MKEFWNERYSVDKFVYGKQPNGYFKEKLLNLPPGKILLPGEGEGRNAVYASELDWKVKAFDQSVVAKQKAIKLAKKRKLQIDYDVSDFENYNDDINSYDCIALIYAHFEMHKREEYHKKMIRFLKPGGVLIIEGFSKHQIHNKSGGPKKTEMLFSKGELINDFKDLKIFELSETDIILNEGEFHRGKASVIRMTGIKND